MSGAGEVPATGSGRTLIIAWGNPARFDDGLGPAVARAVERGGDDRLDVEVDYQLQIEHADDVARYRRVVFVDAARTGPEPFSLRRASASGARARFSTHSASPESILAISRALFAAEPEAWILGVRGYEFGGFGERLSAGARRNLGATVEYLRRAIAADRFSEVEPRSVAAAAPELRGGAA